MRFPLSVISMALCGSSVFTPPAWAQPPSRAAAVQGASAPGAMVPLAASSDASAETLIVHLSWGHRAPKAAARLVSITTREATLLRQEGEGLERAERQTDGAWPSRAGAGDVDGLRLTLQYEPREIRPIENLHVIWSDLIARSDADTARRLTEDPAYRRDSRTLTVQLDREGTSGFTVTVDQLLRQQTFWIPALDLFISTGERPATLAQHLAAIEPYAGARILDRVRQEPEATYADYTARWEDMGDPGYLYHRETPGHVIGVTWDSAIPKFGLDRGAGVWSDLGNPDTLRFWFEFGDLSEGLQRSWRSQRLTAALPVVVTTFEKAGVRYEVEQFAYPLQGPPSERRGDIPMVLLQQVTLTELEGRARTLPLSFTHLRKLGTDGIKPLRVARADSGASVFVNDVTKDTLLAVQGTDAEIAWSGVTDYQDKLSRLTATLPVTLAPRASTRVIVKLPSPLVKDADRRTLLALDYADARQKTLAFWNGWLTRGAQFRVPDPVVNALVRANVWHALRLPRRHGGAGAAGQAVKIDLPYTNFAYGQTGAPWPVNQAVYVDYMLYDLRGYHDVSVEELASQFSGNQEPDGHVKGYANWVVYTPGMLYASAKHFLLAGDRASFEALLPQSLAALDWCLAAVKRSETQTGLSRGLVNGPLNDLTGEGIWAFNNAYIYAGLDLFGRALAVYGHPRAAEAQQAARTIRASIQRGFGTASVRSPLVQLRDRTWTPYVPTEADATGRLFNQWYPTDVDTGALHLVRLKALPAEGPLAEALLQDHEDNLFLHGWGIANEPIYNQQATAYLQRDDPRAAIRTFYSYMASGFSHSALEPVEHRWTHHQFFGPPSTDGAWFELFRHMLLQEQDDDALLIAQATPRAWLADGQRIDVERAPTYFGPTSFSIVSRAAAGAIDATIDMPARRAPSSLIVRLRHPEGRKLRAVTVNGRAWTDFDADKEWIRIPHPTDRRYTIAATY